jgi:hypothetical protein
LRDNLGGILQYGSENLFSDVCKLSGAFVST